MVTALMSLSRMGSSFPDMDVVGKRLYLEQVRACWGGGGGHAVCRQGAAAAVAHHRPASPCTRPVCAGVCVRCPTQLRAASERYQLWIKRLELSDDPAAKEYLRFTNAQMLNGGAGPGPPWPGAHTHARAHGWMNRSPRRCVHRQRARAALQPTMRLAVAGGRRAGFTLQSMFAGLEISLKQYESWVGVSARWHHC